MTSSKWEAEERAIGMTSVELMAEVMRRAAALGFPLGGVPPPRYVLEHLTTRVAYESFCAKLGETPEEWDWPANETMDRIYGPEEE